MNTDNAEELLEKTKGNFPFTNDKIEVQRNQVAFQGSPAIKSQGGLKCWLFSLCVLRRVLYVAVILRSRIPAYCDLVTEVGG